MKNAVSAIKNFLSRHRGMPRLILCLIALITVSVAADTFEKDRALRIDYSFNGATTQSRITSQVLRDLDEDVHAYVSQFLLRNSKDPNSVVERTPVRGVYRLNTESQEGRELMLQFSEQHDDEPETPQNPSVDLSLSLFD